MCNRSYYLGGQVEIRDEWTKPYFERGEKLNTLEFAGMVLLSATDNAKNEVWVNDSPNSENAVKPLAMILGKETLALQEKIINT